TPAVEMFVVVAQVVCGAEAVQSLLDSLCLRQLAYTVVEADVLGTNISEGRELLTAIFQVQVAALHLEQGKATVVVPDAYRRLRNGVRIGHLKRRPLNLPGRRARGDQPVVAGAIATLGKLHLNAALKVEPPRCHFYAVRLRHVAGLIPTPELQMGGI